MANDVLYFTALANEFKSRFLNAKIEKIYQPSPYEIVFVLRGKATETLYFSAEANTPRVYASSKKRENPLTAPTFCMLLRKRLAGGVITDVRVLNCDRILEFKIKAHTDMRDEQTLSFIVEMMGRCSNLVLTTPDGIIIDAIKRVSIGGTARPILPNLPYAFLAHNKVRLDETEKLLALDFPIDEKSLAASISGISKETAKEILFLKNTTAPANTLLSMFQCVSDGALQPTVILKNGVAKELLPLDYKSAEGEKKHFDTLSLATEFFYENRMKEVEEDARIRDLKKAAAKLKTKFDKKCLDCKERIGNDLEIEKNRHFGELLYNNIYKAKGGISILDCDDFENSCTVKVPLDPKLTLPENAEAYYKKYRKLKRAKEVATEQLALVLKDIDYLLSITASLSSVTTTKEIKEADEELQSISGKVYKRAEKTKKQSTSTPLKLLINGFTVYVGKNNIQNDEVTFRIADRTDIWLHAKSYHGSHAIIKAENKIVPESVILRVAELAAFYSSAKTLAKVEIDYTLKKFVKRNGVMLGLVHYTDFKTILVEPKQ